MTEGAGYVYPACKHEWVQATGFGRTEVSAGLPGQEPGVEYQTVVLVLFCRHCALINTFSATV